MVCECVPPSPEEDGDTRGCLEDCLNRMLFIEWYIRAYAFLPLTIKWQCEMSRV